MEHGNTQKPSSWYSLSPVPEISMQDMIEDMTENGINPPPLRIVQLDDDDNFVGAYHVTHREETLTRILRDTDVIVERIKNGSPTRYVFVRNNRQIGNPADGIAQAELMAYAIRDYHRMVK